MTETSSGLTKLSTSGSIREARLRLSNPELYSQAGNGPPDRIKDADKVSMGYWSICDQISGRDRSEKSIIGSQNRNYRVPELV